MQNLNKFSKTFLFISVASFAIFIGSYVVKLSMLNQLFQPENLLLKYVFVDKDLTPMFEILIPVFSITVVSFLLLTIASIVFLVSSKISLKENGWLFISFLIFVITAIFEWVLIIRYDLEFVSVVMSNNFDQNMIIDLLRNRVTDFGPFPLILVFSYMVIVYLCLFKPLKSNYED